MTGKTDYTRFARRFATRYPLASYTTIQINFWILANTLLAWIVYLSIMAVAPYLPARTNGAFREMFLFAVILGAIYGLCLGIAEHYVVHRLSLRGNLGHYLIYRLSFSSMLSIGFFWLARYLMAGGSVAGGAATYLFWVCMIYYLIMNVLLIFINQMNTKYGPGILIPLLLGKYAKPVEERRIFLFMDLQSSTALAESLGHIRYSAFIRDSFMDINRLLAEYDAEVYQYVGDEIILSWRLLDPDADAASINFFFACEDRFAMRANEYLRTYGTVPVFKAGIHCGTVTAVEIGDVKREIAYHGDILNTAARIQCLCNDYNAKFLASGDFISQVPASSDFTLKSLGAVTLKGKSLQTKIVSIERPGIILR